MPIPGAEESCAATPRSARSAARLWLCDACFDLLRGYNVALVFADWPDLEVENPVTADFVFARRHGPANLYASNYPDTTLRREARRIHKWLVDNRDVYVYFNDDVRGFAVQNARTLKRLVTS